MKRKTFIKFNDNVDISVDYLLAMFYDARSISLASVSNLSKEELHWKYADGWNSISVLLEHIISINYFFRIFYIENRELTPDESENIVPGLEMGKYIPELITKNKDLNYYLTELNTSQEFMNQEISKLTHEDLIKKIEAYDDESGSNLAWILYHVVEDEIHHRGQISIIRKLYKHNAAEKA